MSAQLAALLYQALASPYGLEVQCSDVEKGKQALYTARREAADPALNILQFRIQKGEILWVTKAGAQMPQVVEAPLME